MTQKEEREAVFEIVREECGLTYSSAPMNALFERIHGYLGSDSYLFLGESGVGKTIIAEYIYKALEALGKLPGQNWQKGKTHNFVSINCAGLPQKIVESELFGHVKGAFSGASENKMGLIQKAHGGALFLDEIGELAPKSQAKLLRALEQKKIRPVGATDEIEVDFILIAATNRAIDETLQNGSDIHFRRDLFYRIAPPVYRIPPLRERSEKEVAELLRMFANKAMHNLSKSQKTKKRSVRFSKEALRHLNSYNYAKNNVRELKREVELAVLRMVNTGGKQIRVEDLSENFRESFQAQKPRTMKSRDKTTLEEAVARRMHQDWFSARYKAGWRYGEIRDNRAKINPLMKSWESLSEEARSFNTVAARNVMNSLNDLGYSLIPAKEVKENIPAGIEKNHIDTVLQETRDSLGADLPLPPGYLSSSEALKAIKRVGWMLSKVSNNPIWLREFINKGLDKPERKVFFDEVMRLCSGRISSNSTSVVTAEDVVGLKRGAIKGHLKKLGIDYRSYKSTK